MCDEFWEVGASGRIYTKKDVVEILLKRYNDPCNQNIWQASDFAVMEIAPDHVLMTYHLIQDHSGQTRRSTIWRKEHGQWKTLYHQGTVVRN